MKLQINKKQLKEALEILAKGVSDKNVMPALSGILFETVDDKLKLYATDLETGIEKYLECDIEEEGKTVVPAHVFKQYIRKLSSGKITLFTENNKLKAEANGSQASFNCYHPDNFTEPQQFDSEPLVLEQSDFKQILDKTSFSATQTNQEGDSATKGVKLKGEGGTLKGVATNRARLAYSKLPISSEKQIDELIPLKAVKILSLLLDEGELKIYSKHNMLKYDLDGYTVYTRLIESEFPNFEKVIPKDFEAELKFETDQLRYALERAILLNEDNNVKLNFQDDKLVIEEYESEIGTINEEVTYKEETDFETLMGINGQYILDGLKTINADNVILKVIDQSKPLVMEVEDNEWTYVIMPVILR